MILRRNKKNSYRMKIKLILLLTFQSIKPKRDAKSCSFLKDGQVPVSLGIDICGK